MEFKPELQFNLILRLSFLVNFVIPPGIPCTGWRGGNSCFSMVNLENEDLHLVIKNISQDASSISGISNCSMARQEDLQIHSLSL